MYTGLDEYPTNTWPDNIELLYYSFHLMITLGTVFIVLMAYASFELAGRLESNTWLLWVLMLGVPFPLHRQHPGLDDGRTGPSTLAHLRPFSHATRAIAK